MNPVRRIEEALESAVASTGGPTSPPRLAQAIRYAVFPGGSWLRPRLCIAVARACGEDAPALAAAAAASVELLHCASLVHDDLPCFDDAETRRGKPSVHRAFGVPLALLAGDALIVLAFQSIARAGTAVPERLPALLGEIGRAVGMPGGIVAGQAWECEPDATLATYQRAKTGALFAAATAAGAAASGADPVPWRELGERLGEAYQVVDDIRDVAAEPDEVGKPTRRDEALGRPNAAVQLGLDGAVARLRALLDDAARAIPACPGATELKAIVLHESQKFLPEGLLKRAA